MAREKVFPRVALCQWYGIAKARGLHIARPRRPGETSWLNELRRGDGSPVIAPTRVATVSDLRMDEAFEAICAMVRLHGLRAPYLTVAWLHEFFDTQSFRASHGGPGVAQPPASQDLVAEVITRAGVATVTGDDVRRHLFNTDCRGLNGYVITDEGRDALRLDAWSAPPTA